MDRVIGTVFRWALRAVLLLMGLVFVASLLVASFMLLLVWLLRAAWARLTGRPVQPLVFTLLRRTQWQRFYRGGAGTAAETGEVIDVESRQVDAGPTDRLPR